MMQNHSATSNLFLDVQGEVIPLRNLITDTDGNCYDAAKIEQANGLWLYDGRSLAINEVSQATSSNHRTLSLIDPWCSDSDEDVDENDEFLPSPSSPTEKYPKTVVTREKVQRERKVQMSSLSLSTLQRTTAVFDASPSTFELDQDAIFDRRKNFFLHNQAVPTAQGYLHDPHQYYGYESDVLIDSVGMHCLPCRTSNLSGPRILRIFRYQNFPNLSFKTYQTMQPALALAERLILRGSMPFWVNIACGRRYYNFNDDLNRLQECLEPLASNDESHVRKALELLEILGKTVTFDFDDVEGGYACSRPTTVNTSPRTDSWLMPHEILLDNSFRHVVEKYTRLKHPDPAAKLRFNFFLAVVLCHEIAHAFEVKCGNNHYFNFVRNQPIGKWPASRTHEAYWIRDEFAEAGAKWEISTFGDRVKPINHGCDIRYGLVLYNGDWFDCNLFHKNASYRTSRGIHNSIVIPMGYIEEIQQECFWSKPGIRDMQPPKFGPRSIFVGTDTSTMSWRQYSLDREEECLTTQQNLFTHVHSQDYDLVEKNISQLGSKARQRSATVTFSQIYQKPEPRQTDIHQYFHYPESPTFSTASIDTDTQHDSSNLYYDPLLINPSHLRAADKWFLLEEAFCLYYGISSATFLALRQSDDLGIPIDSPFHPRNSHSWTQTELDVLLSLREQHPELSFPIIEAKKREARQRNKERWRVINEMEELCVYLGQSRIEFEKRFADGQKLPMGMTIDNFDRQFRGMLIEKRKEYQQSTSNHEPTPRFHTRHHESTPSSTTDQNTDQDDEPLKPDFSTPRQKNTLDDWIANHKLSLWLQDLQSTQSVSNGHDMDLDQRSSSSSSTTQNPTSAPIVVIAPPPKSPQSNSTRRYTSRKRRRARRPGADRSIHRQDSKYRFDNTEYQRMQTAAAQGHAGLYAYLRQGRG